MEVINGVDGVSIKKDEVDGKMKVLMFLTNNLPWAPSSIASIYQSRWGIEVFFKQLPESVTRICELPQKL